MSKIRVPAVIVINGDGLERIIRLEACQTQRDIIEYLEICIDSEIIKSDLIISEGATRNHHIVRGNMEQASTKIKVDAKTFIESLPKKENGCVQIDEGIISAYMTDILNAVGIDAEAHYQDTDWSIRIKDKNYTSIMPFYDKPEDGVLSSIRYFADKLNSGNDFEAWYSYSRGEHFINLKQKEIKGTGCNGS